MGRVVVSWVLTLIVAGFASAAIYASLRPLLVGVEGPVGAKLVYCVGNCTAIKYSV